MIAPWRLRLLPLLSAVLLDVSTSDESCLRVCVRLREASARARVSSTGLVSHVSQPTQPVPHPDASVFTGLPAAAAAAVLLVDAEVVSVALLAEAAGFEAVNSAAISGAGEALMTGVSVAAATVDESDCWRSGAFSMADRPAPGTPRAGTTAGITVGTRIGVTLSRHAPDPAQGCSA